MAVLSMSNRTLLPLGAIKLGLSMFCQKVGLNRYSRFCYGIYSKTCLKRPLKKKTKIVLFRPIIA